MEEYRGVMEQGKRESKDGGAGKAYIICVQDTRAKGKKERKAILKFSM